MTQQSNSQAYTPRKPDLHNCYSLKVIGLNIMLVSSENPDFTKYLHPSEESSLCFAVTPNSVTEF